MTNQWQVTTTRPKPYSVHNLKSAPWVLTADSPRSHSGRCRPRAISAGAFIHISTSSRVDGIAGIALGWIGATIPFGSVVRKVRRSAVSTPILALRKLVHCCVQIPAKKASARLSSSANQTSASTLDAEPTAPMRRFHVADVGHASIGFGAQRLMIGGLALASSLSARASAALSRVEIGICISHRTIRSSRPSAGLGRSVRQVNGPQRAGNRFTSAAHRAQRYALPRRLV
jgi:hypothetical protein